MTTEDHSTSTTIAANPNHSTDTSATLAAGEDGIELSTVVSAGAATHPKRGGFISLEQDSHIDLADHPLAGTYQQSQSSSDGAGVTVARTIAAESTTVVEVVVPEADHDTIPPTGCISGQRFMAVILFFSIIGYRRIHSHIDVENSIRFFNMC